MRRSEQCTRKPKPGHSVVTAVLVTGLSAGPAAADSLGDRIEAAVPEGFSGQVVVATPAEILYSGAFGAADRERGEPVARDTLFDIGSITKTFTATLMLQLAAEGKVRLDQPLADFFEGLPPETAAITIEQLLTHTSGLPQYSGPDEEARGAASFDAWLAETRPEFAPGDHYAYSNPGYSVLARIVEKVSGQPFEAQLHMRLLDPLGLGAIGYRHLPPEARQAVA
ncbi:MAG: serine hydrolase domain-containing protein, partial [Xanthomonadales bacterium]|nr:serine hydrolase domain-containing protein [Xanthomonadales bacterium]